MQVPGASITKAMLLVATWTSSPALLLGPVASAHLQAIAQLSNPDGNRRTRTSAPTPCNTSLLAAGMTQFRLVTSDPSYTLGQSLVTALDQARLFAKIDQLLPARHRQMDRVVPEHLRRRSLGTGNAGVGVGRARPGGSPSRAPDGSSSTRPARYKCKGKAPGSRSCPKAAPA